MRRSSSAPGRSCTSSCAALARSERAMWSRPRPRHCVARPTGPRPPSASARCRRCPCASCPRPTRRDSSIARS
jgi:hypothetical protein